jgi:hypothetical protein
LLHSVFEQEDLLCPGSNRTKPIRDKRETSTQE